MARPDTFTGALRWVSGYLSDADKLLSERWDLELSDSVQKDLRKMADTLDSFSNLGLDLDAVWETLAGDEECDHEWLDFVGVDPRRECNKCGEKA